MDISMGNARSTVHPRARVLARIAALATLILGLAGLVLVAPAGAAAKSTGTKISVADSPFGKVLMVGSGQFAGYSVYLFSRNTAGACTTTLVTLPGQSPLSCTGAETDKSADWPAVTTVGTPVAGPGVNQHLLGVVHRSDIGGDQVTYGGKLLYLFDQKPHQFTGANFLETVSPLPPWHGLWYLVSPKNGLPVVGAIPLSTQALPGGKTVLAAALYQGMGASVPITVYTYSKDSKGHSSCGGTCALDWPPVLTTAAPKAGAGLSDSSLGTFKRPDGTVQLTYKGKPLYFYSQEVPQLNPANGNPLNPASLGTGNGLAGPKGSGGTFSVVSLSAA